MKPFAITILLFTIVFSGYVSADGLPKDCSDNSQSIVRKEANAGSPKAQYLLGSQLLSGECGSKDPQSGIDYLGKAAKVLYPPALHLIGVIYRQQGRPKGAVEFFYAAAQGGFTLAEVDLGFTHAQENSPVKNLPAAYAWFSVALEHEAKPELKAILERQISNLDGAMTDDEKSKAQELKSRFMRDFGSIPRFHDDP